MNAIRNVRWGRVIAAAVMAEASVMALFFVLLVAASLAGVPEMARPMSPFDYADAMVSSFVMVFLFTLWVARRIDTGFVLHGVLVAGVSIVLFVVLIFVLNGTFWEPPLYIVAHGLKIAGGVAGGLVARKRVVREPSLQGSD